MCKLKNFGRIFSRHFFVITKMNIKMMQMQIVCTAEGFAINFTKLFENRHIYSLFPLLY